MNFCQETMLNFSYGSNLLHARLRERVPSAEAVGVATLPHYELRWHKCSKDGSGKCDIVQTADPTSKVIGVVYQILSAEKQQLDRAEGLGYGYDEKSVEVRLGDNLVQAMTYIASNTDPGLRPYSWYQALVVTGAKQNCFPTEYVAMLESVDSTRDSNAERHDKNMALVNAV